MVKGVQLSLMIGPAVPVPVPREVIDALQSVSVTVATDGQSGFELTFRLSTRSPLHTLFLLTGGSGIPIVRVVIMLTVNGSPEVLMDGVMTQHAVQPGADPGHATLTVRGTDLSPLLEIIPFDGVPYPAMSPAMRVLLVLGKYAALGVVPMVIPSLVEDLPIPVERIPRHIGTDLAYVRRLAQECGYAFYFRPGPAPGVSIAYWGPEIRVGVPQPALNFDMDAHRNVESLSFRYDKDRKEMPVVFIQNQATRAPIPIPIPDVSPLNPPLGAIPPLPPRLRFLNETANLSPLSAVMQGLAHASRHSDCVFGDGTLDVARYGRVLRARELVGVRGVGHAFDGLHYVTSVTTTLRRGEIKQSFQLARNGLLPTVPSVPV